MQQIAFQDFTPAEEPMRKGFSLLELLLVIFIISLVYFLGFEGFDKPKASDTPLTIENLKSNLVQSGKVTQGGIFLCTGQCDSCYYKNASDTTFKPYEGKIALTGTEAYFFNAQNALQKAEFGRFQDQKICLIIQFYPNGSSSRLILKNDKAVYLLPSYLGTAHTFKSLDEAQHFLTENTKTHLRNGDFY